MKELLVALSEGRSYDITIEKGILSRCGQEIRKVYNGNQVCVITDSNVAPLYLGKVTASLKEAGFQVKTMAFAAGEKSKNMETLVSLYDGMLSPLPFPMTRGGLVVALGGGVVGDMVGFAAATLFRGIPFVQIPTTLLAHVDSSVGGKVAVDLKQGKNLAGAFYQPKAVLIDPETLDTLPDRVFQDGLAEVVKYGVLGDERLFSLLESCKDRQELMTHMEEIVYTCCDAKRTIVERDEKDTGDRMLLNFGHTLGHGIETGSGLTLTHGACVALGMPAFCSAEVRARLLPVLKKVGLPTAVSFDPERVWQAMLHDKKSSGGSVSLIVPTAIGHCEIRKTPADEISNWLLAGGAQ